MYGTVRTVVWEDGGGNPASYPIKLSYIEVLLYLRINRTGLDYQKSGFYFLKRISEHPDRFAKIVNSDLIGSSLADQQIFKYRKIWRCYPDKFRSQM